MTDEAMGHVCPPSVVKWLNSPLRKLIQNPNKIMGEYVSPGNTVIDLGCGGGYFAVALAKMVQENGRVIAMDLQQEMLDFTRDLAVRNRVVDRITLHQCEADDFLLTDVKVDFALAFYMVHEVPDRNRFFTQVAAILNPDASFMIIEPKHHVSPFQFKQIQTEAASGGLRMIKPIKLLASRGILFQLSS